MTQKRTFAIALTEDQARQLLAECELRPGVPPESLIEAWIADKLDYERAAREKK